MKTEIAFIIQMLKSKIFIKVSSQETDTSGAIKIINNIHHLNGLQKCYTGLSKLSIHTHYSIPPSSISLFQ